MIQLQQNQQPSQYYGFGGTAKKNRTRTKQKKYSYNIKPDYFRGTQLTKSYLNNPGHRNQSNPYTPIPAQILAFPADRDSLYFHPEEKSIIKNHSDHTINVKDNNLLIIKSNEKITDEILFNDNVNSLKQKIFKLQEHNRALKETQTRLRNQKSSILTEEEPNNIKLLRIQIFQLQSTIDSLQPSKSPRPRQQMQFSHQQVPSSASFHQHISSQPLSRSPMPPSSHFLEQRKLQTQGTQMEPNKPYSYSTLQPADQRYRTNSRLQRSPCPDTKLSAYHSPGIASRRIKFQYKNESKNQYKQNGNSQLSYQPY